MRTGGSASDPEQLRTAIDFASNWEIRGGVWRYGIELTKALVRQLPPGTVKVPCYDRLPPEPLKELASTRASISQGPAAYYDLLDSLSRRRGRLVAWDKVLPLVYTDATRQRLFQLPLRNVDVYHAAFTCRGALRNGVTVGSIQDLIPILHPEGSSLSGEKLLHMIESHRRWSEIVLVPSEATMRDLINHLDFPADRMRLVHYGINTDVFHPRAVINDDLLVSHGLRPGHFFLYVGALERRKNIERLVDAYREVVTDPSAFPLALVGTRVDDLPRVDAALKDRSSGVKHLGYIADHELPGLYRAACVLVHVASIEGFGFTPLEAMACGTPAIVSRGTATGEMAGEVGMLVNPTDVADIARALREIRTNTELRARLGARSQAHAASFTWEKCAMRTYDVYREAYLLRRHSRGV